MSRTPRRVPLTVAAVATVLLLGACATASDPGSGASGPAPAPSAAPASTALDDLAWAVGGDALRRERVTVGAGERALVVDVLVADTAPTRARGLQGVAEVPDGVGMLFVFDGPSGPWGRPGFWMLDTLVPLDIAFAADGVVVGLATMTPCPASPCPVTHPGVDYDVALEVAAGALTDAGVAVGDPLLRRLDGAG